MGRELYLQNLIHSIHRNAGIHHINFEYHIGWQGVRPTQDMKDYIYQYHHILHITNHYWDDNCGAGHANNRIIPELSGNLVIKLDDDTIIHSQDFFKHILEISRLEPNIIFSPYPVGLINNPGGV